MSPDQEKTKRKAQMVLDNRGSTPLAMLDALMDASDSLREVAAEIKKEKTLKLEGAEIKKIKGDKGDKGDPGDTPTRRELLNLIEPLIPDPIKGDTPTEKELKNIIIPLLPKAIRGDDGYTPKKGVDYFDGEKGDKGDRGVPGKDMVQLEGADIVAMLESLEDDFRLSPRAIKNLPQYIRDIAGSVVNPGAHSGAYETPIKDSNGRPIRKDASGAWILPVSSGGSGAAIGGPVTDGTKGSVLYIDPDSTLAQDNANFFWDSTNKRLGIGTNSPSTPIHIVAGLNGPLLTLEGTIAYPSSGQLQAGIKMINYIGGNWTMGMIDNSYTLEFLQGSTMKFQIDGNESSFGLMGTQAAPETALTIPKAFANPYGTSTMLKLQASGYTSGTGGFSGIFLNSVMTYGGSGEALMIDLQQSGTSVFKVATSGAVTFNNTYTFPTTDGSSGQVPQTDGAGNVSWQTVSGGGGTGLTHPQVMARLSVGF